MKYFVLVCFCILVSTTQAQTIFPSETGSALQLELRNNYYPTSVYSYDRARDTLYARIDRVADSVECVYTGYKVGYLYSEGDASTVVFNKGINAEHTWPQSFYNSSSPMVSDLHQLYPAWDDANSTRNNHPFAEIDDDLTTTWLYKGITTNIKPTVDIDLYAEYYNKSFEPRESHKGNVARTLFYFWTMYQKENAIKNDESDNKTWFNNMKSMLYEWHKQDPADQNEINRSNLVATFQGKQNPFVHDSSLIFRAYFEGIFDIETETETESDSTLTLTYPGQIIISQYYEGASYDKWLEIANVGQFDYDFSSSPLYVQLFTNPKSDLTGVSPSNTYALTGILKADSVLLFRNTDSKNPKNGVGTAISVCNFNGDDVVILSSATGTNAWENRIDVFGIADGTNFAQDICYVRKSSVVKGSDTWNQSDWEIIDYTLIDSTISPIHTNYLGKHRSQNAIVISGSQGWRMLSIPADNWPLSNTLSNLWTQGATGSKAPSSGSNLYTYNETANQFEAVTSLENSSGIGNGYLMYVYSDDNFDGDADNFPKIISYDDGNVEITDHNFTVSYQNVGWNLIGNPYPFAIDWDSPEWTKTNVNNTIYIYDNDLKLYKTWNGVTGTNGLENGIIPAFQSFFVNTNAENPILSVTPEAKSESIPLYKKQTPQEIRLRYKKSEVVIVFVDEAEIGLDKYDALEAPVISNLKPIQLQHEGINFSINALPTHLDNPMTFRLNNVSNPDLITLINSSTYSYDLTQELGFWNFTIYPISTSIKQNEVLKEIPAELAISSAFPNPFNPSTNINVTLTQNAQVDISVYNTIGQKVQSFDAQLFHKGQNTFTFNAANLATGVYIIQFKTNNSVQTSKVILVK